MAAIVNGDKIAYFSMEIGLESHIPTYSGGLGVLAGDTLKSSSDLGLPMVAVSLLYRKGYFRQEIDFEGWQKEHAVEWNPADYMELLPYKVSVTLEGRQVWIQAWKYAQIGSDGHELPIYFLDTDLPENHEWDQRYYLPFVWRRRNLSFSSGSRFWDWAAQECCAKWASMCANIT